MQSSTIHHYRGYAISPSVHRLADGTFSSNLVLRGADTRSEANTYAFYSLEYFGNEEAALRYSNRWAREWIDNRG